MIVLKIRRKKEIKKADINLLNLINKKLEKL
jgi:hypothetical protein